MSAPAPLAHGIGFYKMSGSGNDFVMFDGRLTPAEDLTAERIRRLCDRRRGIGADGVVVLSPTGLGAVTMAYWNADGSRAALCGNASLCSARLSAELCLSHGSDVCLLTDAGPVQARGCRGEADAEINIRDVGPTRAADAELGPGERWIALGTVGVPHLIVRVDDVERADVDRRGRELRHHPSLGDPGANVNFVSPAAGHPGVWALRTFERGVEGETLACGTGTVAAALALAEREEAALPIELVSRGGAVLRVSRDAGEAAARGVWLGGEAALVYTGRLAPGIWVI